MQKPIAKKQNPPRNPLFGPPFQFGPQPKRCWPSNFAEYKLEGEPCRFRYVVGVNYTTSEIPAPGPNGERRVLARIVGKRGEAIALFEELANRPA